MSLTPLRDLPQVLKGRFSVSASLYFDFGDGSEEVFTGVVTAVDADLDSVFVRSTLTHVYAETGSHIAAGEIDANLFYWTVVGNEGEVEIDFGATVLSTGAGPIVT